MIGKFIDWYQRRRVRKLKRLLMEVYPDQEKRALTLMAEGAKEFETLMFGRGETVRAVILTRGEEDAGYNVEIGEMEEIDD